MSRDLTGALARWLAEGERQMGEVLIRSGENGWELRHVADAEVTDDLCAGQAREIALLTEAGEYRPLKTAPNLRRGWSIRAGTVSEVREALDAFYPSMLGVLLDWQGGALPVVPLRGTLARQSGMYAVTRKLTDEQAQELIGGFCRSDGGCLKTILWRISPEVPVRSLPPGKFDPEQNEAEKLVGMPLPMLCHESCNLLIAKAREIVKGQRSDVQASV